MAGAGIPQLDKHRREAAYPIGAALAMVLDSARPEWPREYFERPFALPDF